MTNHPNRSLSKEAEVFETYDFAHQLGASLQPGDHFVGAMQEARYRGYGIGTPLYRTFVHAYLDGLNAKSVTVDGRGRIISIEKTAARVV